MGDVSDFSNFMNAVIDEASFDNIVHQGVLQIYKNTNVEKSFLQHS